MIDYVFRGDKDQPHLVLVLPQAMEGTEGTATLISLASVYDEALQLAHKKNISYGDAWRRQGWMGNLARMMSKMSRIKHMLWRDHDLQSAEESATDTAIDLINITGFLVINRSETNKWGNR